LEFDEFKVAPAPNRRGRVPAINRRAKVDPAKRMHALVHCQAA